jgi:hypothetical protein
LFLLQNVGGLVYIRLGFLYFELKKRVELKEREAGTR